MMTTPSEDTPDQDLVDEQNEILAHPPEPEAIEQFDDVKPPRTKKFGRRKGDPVEPRNVTVSMRINTKIEQQLKYWSDKHELTATEYITEALQDKIARENGDYDLPTLEQARLAQMHDEMRTMNVTMANLVKQLDSATSLITVLSHAPSYLSQTSESLDHERP